MKPHLLDFVNRWRHTLGYGVHSPLAYRIIKECVHPDTRYAYYGDFIIGSHSEGAEMCRQLRLIIRLVNTLHLKESWMPDCPGTILKILKKAYPTLNIHTGSKPSENTDFIVFFSNPSAKIILQLPTDLDQFTILNFSKPDRLEATIKNHTLTLTATSFSLYIRRPSMSPVNYRLL